MAAIANPKLTFDQFLEQYPDGEGRYDYQDTAFKGDAPIISRTFPKLSLTVNQILDT